MRKRGTEGCNVYWVRRVSHKEALCMSNPVQELRIWLLWSSVIVSINVIIILFVFSSCGTRFYISLLNPAMKELDCFKSQSAPSR